MGDLEDEFAAFEKEINGLSANLGSEGKDEDSDDLKAILKAKKAENFYLSEEKPVTFITSKSEQIIGKPTVNPVAVPKKIIQEAPKVEEPKVSVPIQYNLPKVSPGKGNLRQVGTTYWEDKTLDEWPENDFRVFVGNLGKEVTNKNLEMLFNRFPSFNMAKIVTKNKRVKNDGKRAAFNVRREVCKGYGFVSFSDPRDMLKAVREMHGKHCQDRPMHVKRSKWADREVKNVRKRQKKAKQEKQLF